MITNKDINKLKNNAMDYALMMDDHEIEEVIVVFVGVKNSRDRFRRGS